MYASASSASPAPTALVQRTGAEIGAPVHIYSSDRVFIHLLLNCHSRQACIGYQTQKHSQSSAIPLPFARAGRTMTPICTVQSGSPWSKPSTRLSKPVPGEQGSPQSMAGLTKRRRGLRQSSAAALGLKEMRGPAGLGAGPQQPAASRGSQYTKAVGSEQETWMPQEAQAWRSESTKPTLPSQPPTSTELGTRGAQFSFIPHSPGLERGLGKHQLPPLPVRPVKLTP